MKAKCWLSAAAGAIAMSLWALPAQAASIPGSMASLKAAGHAETMVEGTHWRRRYAYYYGGYYPSYYYSYPRYRYYSYSYPSYGYYAYPSYGYRHHHHRRYYRNW